MDERKAKGERTDERKCQDSDLESGPTSGTTRPRSGHPQRTGQHDSCADDWGVCTGAQELPFSALSKEGLIQSVLSKVQVSQYDLMKIIWRGKRADRFKNAALRSFSEVPHSHITPGCIKGQTNQLFRSLYLHAVDGQGALLRRCRDGGWVCNQP